MATGSETVRDHRDHRAADRGPDDRDQVQQGDEQGQQDRVRNPERHRPQVRAETGDHRRGHVAEDERADLGEDLVAEQDDPGPPGARGQPAAVPSSTSSVAMLTSSSPTAYRFRP
jgi:hypothetical protein